MIPASPIHNRPWQEQAACRDADPELFDTVAAVRQVPPEAADHCAVCPVKAQCLDLAMRAEGGTGPQWRFGIFAGTSPDQRAKAWPKWADAHGISRNAYRVDLAPCGTPAAYRRHQRLDEPIDPKCAQAEHERAQARRDREAKRKRAQRARQVLKEQQEQREQAVCGTASGFRRHQARGEDPCGPCTDAREATGWYLQQAAAEAVAA